MAMHDWNNDGKKDCQDSFLEYQLYRSIYCNKDSDRAYAYEKKKRKRKKKSKWEEDAAKCNDFSLLILVVITVLSGVLFIKFFIHLQIFYVILSLLSALSGGLFLSSDLMRKDEYRLDFDKCSDFKFRFFIFIVATISLIITLKYL